MCLCLKVTVFVYCHIGVNIGYFCTESQTNSLLNMLLVLFVFETKTKRFSNTDQHVFCCSSLVVLPSQGGDHHRQKLLESCLDLTSEFFTQLGSNHDGQAVRQQLKRTSETVTLKVSHFAIMNEFTQNKSCICFQILP